MNSETHGQESETERIWRSQSDESVRAYADGSEDAQRFGEGTRDKCVTPNREDSQKRVGSSCALGGILDQLIDDAEKQLVKSRECIVWYTEEVKDYEQKLNNLRKLKELQQKQEQEATIPRNQLDSEE
ncbi:hypothetical protein [Microcoleus sp. EPA2]|uniref:hypothetical protein n=1 Tax=Microcoleus sp. EPA2 TaxID=2841654 RepID=UPI00312B4D5F